jgi:hypothetical protein
LFFPMLDALPQPIFSSLPSTLARPALVREEHSPYWRQLLAGNLFAPAAQAENPPPTIYGGVQIQLIDEGVDAQGRWYQTFRATIRPGGTLSDAAIAIYNDLDRTDDVFRAAQSQNPNLTNPAYVFVGQEIDITIDPATISVLQESKQAQDGAARQLVYYNRIVETIHRQSQDGILRTIDFPNDERTERFVFASSFQNEEELIEANPGARVVDYAYVQGEAFGDVVRKLFDVNSATAANELVRQTEWNPNNWPPTEQAQIRVVVDTLASYEDIRPNTLDFVPDDPAAQQEWRRLTSQREAAGIYPLRMEREGIVYHVLVGAGNTTAKQASRLLFNSEAAYLDIARAAGIQLPSNDPSKVPPEYDPLLIGSAFEIQVPFSQERFPVAGSQIAEDGSRITRLANGTMIYDYDQPEDKSGLLQVVYYPNGYKSVSVRPNEIMLLALDFVHFQFLNIASPDMPREQREQLSHDFQARMLWSWSRSVPRTAEDVAENLHMRVGGDKAVLEVLTYQRQEVPWYERLMFEMWFTYPFVVATIVVVIGTAILFAASMHARRIQTNRRRRYGRGG